MQRSLLVALFLLLVGALATTWWLFSSDGPPLVPAGTTPVAEAPEASLVAASGPAATEDPAAGATGRTVAAIAEGLLADPEIRAGLCGFKGRVVDHEKRPVAECGVRIYRGAMDVIIPVNTDLFAEEIDNEPRYVAGESKTDAEGKWQVTGIWPKAFYLLFAGIGTDAPMHQVISRSPSPGEVVDLGDIVLPHAGVIVGTVVDDNGDPLAGALVRAADVPGTLAAFFPFERIHPDSVVLVRESNSPVRVIEAPRWARNAFEHLPIPTARTSGDGRFRLIGVVPGSNMLATTAAEFLSDVKPSVQVRAGQEKDVGTIRMKRGEELTGKVVDTAGKAVVDAEVLAGTTLSMVPFDLAQRVGKSDAEGRFTGQGFSGGKVTVAARRGKGHAWVLAEPQPILGNVVVTLPASFGVDVAVTLADGKPAKTTRMQLLQGRAGNGAAEMHMFGIVPPIDLTDRKRDAGEGKWRIENLNPGSYTLIVDAPGHAMSCAPIDITDADTSVTLALTTPSAFVVRVLTAEDKPIRNASIYAEARGGNVIEMPTLVGRTAGDGKLVIDTLRAERLRVSAEHPRWGTVHGDAKLDVELVLRMQAPGTLRGVVLENGKPPEPGKFSVAIERRRGENEANGPIEVVPDLVTPGLDGTFVVAALQPGRYQVQAIKSLDALRSPGGVFALAQDMFMTRDTPDQEVQLAPGQTVEVTLEAGEKPLEGPTARLSGTITIDGKVGAGHVVTARSERRRFSAKADIAGRFDLGTVPAGELDVALLAGSDGVFLGPNESLWASEVKLADGESRELTIEVMTSSIRGICYDATGAPAANHMVQASGQLKSNGADGEGHRSTWAATTTNAEGEFHFARIAEGTWSVTVRRGGGNAVLAQVKGLTVQAAAPVTGVRLDLLAPTVVKGKIDLAMFAGKKPEWMWMSIHRLGDNDAADAEGDWADGVSVDKLTGAFHTEDLTPGRYRLRLHASVGDREGGEYPFDVLMVPAGGLAEVTLRPGPRITR